MKRAWRRWIPVVLITGSLLSGCTPGGYWRDRTPDAPQTVAVVPLKADVSHLNAKQKRVLRLLVEAARQMDAVYWRQTCCDPSQPPMDESVIADRRFGIHYGPWNRFHNHAPLYSGVAPKPKGAGFYPADMEPQELEAAVKLNPELGSPYTLVKRNAIGLKAEPYHLAYRLHHERAAAYLEQAADLVEEAPFRAYLRLRAKALRNDRYQASDFAWVGLRNNPLDIIIGPIESYEDAVLGVKTAHEALVLLRDPRWERELGRYVEMLPRFQRELPVAARYKREKPGLDTDLAAYDVLFHAGQANSVPKAIAINLPNDEQVQLQKGTRSLQLKNVMRAKFDTIVVPMAAQMVQEDQRSEVNFESFFSNTMLHELAHGLGIKHTLDGRTVRKALGAKAMAFEEAKADLVGLHLVNRLRDRGVWSAAQWRKSHITSLVSIFRSIRFGTTSAHGLANLMRFNYLSDKGVLQRDGDGRYRVQLEQVAKAVDEMAGEILTLQGDGNHGAITGFLGRYGQVGSSLAEDLEAMRRAGLMEDVAFVQKMELLKGL
ncbi:MAG: Zn-dependent hydrolase [Magnetococcales bacterium]|nr:Zn-dependent hydrolase [Magnetococcales bacterium]